MNTFLASDGSPSDRAALLRGAFWLRPYQDGRSSEAMLALLELLRQQERLGLPVQVAVAGVAQDPDTAQRLLALRARSPDAAMLVLSGNVHARTVVGTPWDASFESLGVRLARRIPNLTSLDVHFDEGTVWSCELTPKVRLACGVHRPAPPVHELGFFEERAFRLRTLFRRPPSIERWSEPSAGGGFQGVYYVGSLTASLPAAPGLAPNR